MRDNHGRFLRNPDDRRLTKVYGVRLPARLEPVLLDLAAASGVEPTVCLRALVTEALDALTVASDGYHQSQAPTVASDGKQPLAPDSTDKHRGGTPLDGILEALASPNASKLSDFHGGRDHTGLAGGITAGHFPVHTVGRDTPPDGPNNPLESIAPDSPNTPLTVPEFAQRTGQKPKTLNTQIQRGIFEKQNPGWQAQRGARGKWLISPIARDEVG